MLARSEGGYWAAAAPPIPELTIEGGCPRELVSYDKCCSYRSIYDLRDLFSSWILSYLPLKSSIC